MANSPEEEEEEEAAAAAAEAEAEIRLSPLHQLLSGEKSALWEPFRDTTEVQEQKLLRQLASEKPLRQRPSLSRHHLRQNGMTEAWCAFGQISLSTRQLLKQAFPHNDKYDLVCSLEATLFRAFMPAYLHMAVDTAQGFSLLPTTCLHELTGCLKCGEYVLLLLLDNQRDRKICHGVCQYYSLLSWSETNAQGHRVTVVTLPKGRSAEGAAHVPGGIILSYYLARFRDQGKREPC
jgi:hypothetical protein